MSLTRTHTQTDTSLTRAPTSRILSHLGDAGDCSHLALEARELLDLRHAPLLDLLTGMLRESVSERMHAHAALCSLGPVWAVRLQSVEMMAPSNAADHADWAVRALSHAVQGTARASGATVKLGRAWAHAVPKALAFTLKGALGVLRFALGGWMWGQRERRRRVEARV